MELRRSGLLPPCGALSLAVALVAYQGRGLTPATVRPSIKNEVRLRNERIAFFEARVARDPIDYGSLNVLTSNYLQRARETGDVADFQRAEIAATRSLASFPQ